LRRNAPTLKLLAESGYAAPSDSEMNQAPVPPPASPAAPAASTPKGARPLRSVALGVLGALALRGLTVGRRAARS
jgi:hypothetical protein